MMEMKHHLPTDEDVPKFAKTLMLTDIDVVKRLNIYLKE